MRRVRWKAGARPARPGAPPARPRIGERLVEAELLDEAQLARALDAHRACGGRLVDWVERLGLAPVPAVQWVLGIHLGVPAISERSLLRCAARAVARRLPADQIRALEVLPIAEHQGWVYVATPEPADLDRLDRARFALGAKVRAVLCSRDAFARAAPLAGGA